MLRRFPHFNDCSSGGSELENCGVLSEPCATGRTMVLEPQTMLPNMANGALQLYAAAAAAQFGGPRSRVPPWAPFLQFGMPGMGMFGNSFLTRPRFGPATGATVGSPIGSLGGGGGGNGGHPALPGHPMGAGGIAVHMSRNNTNNNSSSNSNLGAQSDDDDDDKGECYSF